MIESIILSTKDKINLRTIFSLQVLFPANGTVVSVSPQGFLAGFADAQMPKIVESNNKKLL